MPPSCVNARCASVPISAVTLTRSGRRLEPENFVMAVSLSFFFVCAARFPVRGLVVRAVADLNGAVIRQKYARTSQLTGDQCRAGAGAETRSTPVLRKSVRAR